jgi:hypothetical protein
MSSRRIDLLHLIVVVAMLPGCDGGPTACPTPLSQTHLWESNCPGGNGYCFVDHEVPF